MVENGLVIYAIRWKEPPVVRLSWTFKDFPAKSSDQRAAISALKANLATTMRLTRAENKELKSFLIDNPGFLDELTFKDAEFIKLDHIPESLLDTATIVNVMKMYEQRFINEGNTVINFGRFKIRLPKKAVTSTHETGD